MPTESGNCKFRIFQCIKYRHFTILVRPAVYPVLHVGADTEEKQHLYQSEWRVELQSGFENIVIEVLFGTEAKELYM